MTAPAARRAVGHGVPHPAQGQQQPETAGEDGPQGVRTLPAPRPPGGGRCPFGGGPGGGTRASAQGGWEPRSVCVRTYGSGCGVTIRDSAASASAAVSRRPGSFASSACSTGPSAPARTAGRGSKPLFIDENRDSRLEQGVVRDGLFLLVVVVLDESVVTQQNRCEPIQIFRYSVRADVHDVGPRLCLLVIPGIGEKSFECGDVTDGRLLAAAVQAGRVPLLETSWTGCDRTVAASLPRPLFSSKKNGASEGTPTAAALTTVSGLLRKGEALQCSRVLNEAKYALYASSSLSPSRSAARSDRLACRCSEPYHWNSSAIRTSTEGISLNAQAIPPA